jgi:C_GCAxxG_C_C family probable redox protein
MTKPERALELFSRQFNCAQSVFAAYGPDDGLDERHCLMLAAPLGGGLGRLGETCGAVNGALLVIGLRYGGPAATDPQAKAELYARVREFVAAFKARNPSIVCRELLGCDISTPEGLQKAQERQLFEKFCPKYVRDAAEILDEMQARDPAGGPA